MLAFDSNVFIYILDKNPEFFDKAQAALRRITEESSVISTLVYTETLSKLSGKTMADSRNLLDSLCQRYHINVLAVDTELAVIAARLRGRYRSLRTPDALHIATALAGGAKTLITNDLSLTRLSIEGLVIQGL